MKKSILKIKIIAPLAPLYDGDEDLINGIKELIELDKCLNLDIYNTNVSLNIVYHQSYKLYLDQFYGEKEVIIFEIIVTENYKDLKIGTYKDGMLISQANESISRDYWEATVLEDFKLKVYYLIILYQIARPGSIRLRKGEIYVNDKFTDVFFATNVMHREAIDLIKKIKWPVYKVIPFSQVWEWFTNNNFSFKRYSKLKIERALNAFTYLFDESQELSTSLLWALIGIEALYATSKEGISDQIFNKTQILLGPITDFKRKLKQMYDFRSRLVHGDLDIPPHHHDFTGDEDDAFQDNYMNQPAWL